MKLSFTLASAVLAAALTGAPAAQAVTFTFAGGTDFVLPDDYYPLTLTPGLTPGTTVLANGTLGLSGPGRVTFSYIGSDAGDSNRFLLGGTEIFNNRMESNPPVTTVLGAGPLDFAFAFEPSQQVANGASSGFLNSIALFRVSDTSAYALFNDGWPYDQDYDDLVVRLDVAPVPLPAAAWLLMAGLGGLALVKRRAAAVA